MTDRELLEKAAKAANLQNWKIDGKSGAITYSYAPEHGWNPLTDDGDALRLAVKLRLELDVHHTGIAVRTPQGHKILIDADAERDPYTATRRAIVRAAAAIGEQMP